MMILYGLKQQAKGYLKMHNCLTALKLRRNAVEAFFK